MKTRFRPMWSVLLLAAVLNGQTDYSPIVLYWKTLQPAEKEFYLFAYLTQVYETHKSLIDETGRGDFTKWYYENRAEMAYTILEYLEGKDATKFIEWVDDFYRQDEFRDRPFYEALRYAYTRSQVKGQTLLEKYESIMGQPKKKPD
ncbi:MAG: hypothetical protein QF613_04745 [Candidatus Marinimicrobia bacterium]|nr:hypothetical protein [Candidatus Neomarinimicrobiota bacterium]MDP6593495.1 hypothetical protein [Candidatus Neomarinimicrobiota bacterium]MDP6836899.1 hypothetical protein [Candidatus Neomarinimicrobiota bacterium]MDP6967000.1 hypothetical protein [Candidatus Neomarinimicrobiota bacterium]